MSRVRQWKNTLAHVLHVLFHLSVVLQYPAWIVCLSQLLISSNSIIPLLEINKVFAIFLCLLGLKPGDLSKVTNFSERTKGLLPLLLLLPERRRRRRVSREILSQFRPKCLCSEWRKNSRSGRLQCYSADYPNERCTRACEKGKEKKDVWRSEKRRGDGHE